MIETKSKNDDYTFNLFQITQSMKSKVHKLKKVKPKERDVSGKRKKKHKKKEKKPFFGGKDSITDLVSAPNLNFY